HHERRRTITLPGSFKDLFPLHVRAAQDARDELAHVVARRAGLAGRLAWSMLGGPIAHHNFGPADQDARVNAKRVADDAKDDHRADAQPAAAHAHWQAETATTSATFAAA